MVWSRFALVTLSTLVACSGGDAALGEHCGSQGDCDSALQCIDSTCVPRCQRAPDCGDGYSCDQSGICRLADGQLGDACESEAQCGPGLACRIDGPDVDDPTRLVASCAKPDPGRPPAAACEADAECRDGTCALGRCIDLCDTSRDCPATDSCQTIPRGALVEDELVETSFRGCIPARGNLRFAIPVSGVKETVLLPVPSNAQQATLVMTLDDATQRAGATRVVSPSGAELLTNRACTEDGILAEFYANKIRHQPLPGQSVLAFPSSPTVPLETGDYLVDVSSLRQCTTPGSEIPRVTAVLRLGAATQLDLHFHFLDLGDHPCQGRTNGATLRAAAAAVEPYFQNEYLPQIRSIFSRAGITVQQITYDDITNHPELDELAAADAGSLLALGDYATGINIFFVRAITPSITLALGPSPGPAGVERTRQSGIALGVDTLCYRTWADVARLTSHQIAKYMGLYNTFDFEVSNRNTPDAVVQTFFDPLPDTSDALDDASNLLFFSDLPPGGIQLTPQQRDILLRSPVLQ